MKLDFEIIKEYDEGSEMTFVHEPDNIFTKYYLQEDSVINESIKNNEKAMPNKIGFGGTGVALSSDGSKLITCSVETPCFTVQQLNPGTGKYDKVQDLRVGGQEGRAVTMSADEQFIVVAYKAHPYYSVFKRAADQSYERLQSLYDVGAYGYIVSISGDGSTIVVACWHDTPIATVHKYNETKGTFEKVQELVTDCNYCRAIDVSYDGSVVVVAHNYDLYRSSTPAVSVWEYNGVDTYERKQLMTTFEASVRKSIISNDKNTLVVLLMGYMDAHRVFIYKRNTAGTYDLDQVLHTTDYSGASVALSGDSNTLVTLEGEIVTGKYRIISIYKQDAGLYELVETHELNNKASELAVSNDGSKVAVAAIFGPTFSVYTLNTAGTGYEVTQTIDHTVNIQSTETEFKNTPIDFARGVFSKEAQRLTTLPVEAFGVKAFPQFGSYGWYTEKYTGKTRVLAPINAERSGYSVPKVSVEVLTSSLKFTIEDPTSIEYDCYRILMRHEFFADEFITYERVLEIPKLAQGKYLLTIIGYREEGNNSLETMPIEVEIT